jgi:hypothetical protein
MIHTSGSAQKNIMIRSHVHIANGEQTAIVQNFMDIHSA